MCLQKQKYVKTDLKLLIYDKKLTQGKMSP